MKVLPQPRILVKSGSLFPLVKGNGLRDLCKSEILSAGVETRTSAAGNPVGAGSR
jgi:hypothetical protein